jgi:hypothetical protein
MAAPHRAAACSYQSRGLPDGLPRRPRWHTPRGAVHHTATPSPGGQCPRRHYCRPPRAGGGACTWLPPVARLPAAITSQPRHIGWAPPSLPLPPSMSHRRSRLYMWLPPGARRPAAVTLRPRHIGWVTPSSCCNRARYAGGRACLALLAVRHYVASHFDPVTSGRLHLRRHRHRPRRRNISGSHTGTLAYCSCTHAYWWSSGLAHLPAPLFAEVLRHAREHKARVEARRGRDGTLHGRRRFTSVLLRSALALCLDRLWSLIIWHLLFCRRRDALPGSHFKWDPLCWLPFTWSDFGGCRPAHSG